VFTYKKGAGNRQASKMSDDDWLQEEQDEHGQGKWEERR
jgi:hypothetical protein